MTGDQIEDMMRELIEIHLSEEFRRPALEWLEKRVICYAAMAELGLIDTRGRRAGKSSPGILAEIARDIGKAQRYASRRPTK
jgi:hypothetical protein